MFLCEIYLNFEWRYLNGVIHMFDVLGQLNGVVLMC